MPSDYPRNPAEIARLFESTVVEPVAPPKKKTEPDKKKKGLPDPFKPPKPKHKPEPKNVVMSFILEAYEDDVNPDTVRFWNDLPKNRQHFYGKHRIMAMHGNDLSKKSYDFTNSRAQKVGATDPRAVFMAFQRIIQREAEHKAELEALAKRVIAQVWGVPEQILDGMISHEVEINAQRSSGDDAEQLTALTPDVVKQINKRITLNAFTQGSAVHNMMTMHYIVDKELREIDPELLKLYDMFSSGSHREYWMMDLAFAAANMANGAVGSENIQYDDDGSPLIVARAIMFPILLQELSKGVMELISHHGLADLDPETTQTVLKYADRVDDEAYLIQVGPELWRRFIRLLPNDAVKARVMTALALQDPDKLEEIVATVIEKPEEAKQIIADLITEPGEFDIDDYADDPGEPV